MPDNPPINAIPSGAPALIGAPIYRTSTQPDGTFIVDLKPGNYLVCIQPDDFEHLDPCRWSRPTSAFIAATATSKTSLGSLSLEKGVPVRVILDDPNLLLGDETQVRLGARVQVGFQYPNGIFEPFRLESAGVVGNGFTYQYAAALPVARDLKVTLITHRIQLMDERNNPVRLNGASYPILLLASERERVLRFRAVSTVPGGAR